MQRSTFLRRTGGLALSAALALGAYAQAAEPALSPADARQQDLDVLYQSLVRYHPDLFANTPGADFLARKAEIEAWLAGESDVDFSLDLQSLAALAGDSHTQVSLNAVADQVRFYPMVLTWYDGHWYLTTAEQAHGDLLGSEVTAVNGHSMEAVLESFSALLSADNPVKLRRQYRQSCNVADLYEYVGLVPDRHKVEFGILHVAAGVFGAVRRGVVDSVAENIKSRRVNVARIKNFRHDNLHLSVRFGEVGSEASDQSAFMLRAEGIVAGAVLGAVDEITVIALFHIDAAVASDSRFRRRVVFKSGETVIFSRAADKSEQ